MLPYSGALFLMSFVIPFWSMPEFLFFFFMFHLIRPFKFIVSFLFSFKRITEAVLMRTIRGEFCYMAHAIRLVVDLARRYWMDCSLRFNQVTLLAIGRIGGDMW